VLVVREEHVVQRVGLGDEPGHDRRRIVAGRLELGRQIGESGVQAVEPGA